MIAPRYPLLPVAVFAACAIAAWLATRTPSSDAADGDSAAGTRATKTERIPTKSGPPSEVLAMLAPVRAAKDTEERLRATIQLASNIPVADIEKWLKAGWFDGTDDMQASLFTRTLLSRWQEEDPAAMLAFCLRREIRITYEFAREWARRDPAAVLACIGQEKDPRLRSSMLSHMGEAMAKSNPRLVASHIGDLYKVIGQDGRYHVSGMIRALAGTSPELLKDEAAKWPKELQDLASSSIASAALKKNLRNGIADLSRSEEGKRVFMNLADSDSEVMKHVSRDPGSLPPGWLRELLSNGGSSTYYMVQDDPMKWLNRELDFEALGLDEKQAQNLRTYAFSHLASKDPEKLKSLIAGQELNDQERGHAIGALASQMKKEDAEAWIAGLSEGDRQIAQAQLSSRRQYDEYVATPDNLLGELAKDGRQVAWADTRAMNNWGREQMQAVEAQFDALPAEQKALIAGKFLTNRNSEVPVEFNAKLVGYLLANPASAAAPKAEETPGIAGHRQADPLAMAACNIAARWGLENPAAAAGWIKGLPSGDVRTWAARNLVVQWAEYDPAAARRWAASMPAGEREGMEKALQDRNAH